MKKLTFLILPFFLFLTNCEAPKSAQKNKPKEESGFLKQGSGKFSFSDYESLKDGIMDVYYFKPKDLSKDAPILFVMHGTLRNADTYRDNWKSLADKYGILVIVPQFTKENFPGSRSYNYGNLRTKDKELVDEKYWSYSLLDPIFDYIISKTGMDAKSYDIFGHSAGSQFVHRMLLFKGKTKAKRLVASNAGTYTMPLFDISFPYGLKDMDYKKNLLKDVFLEKLIIQLGKEDTDPNHKYLNTSKEAMSQGAQRYKRGHNFYKTSKKVANQEGFDFNWQTRTVPNVGHNNEKMAIDAATYLYGK